MKSLVYLLVTFLILYIILKHYFSKNDNESINEYDFDRLVEDKKRALGGDRVPSRTENIINKSKAPKQDSYMKSINKELAWGGDEALRVRLVKDVSNFLKSEVDFQNIFNLTKKLSSNKSKSEFLSSIVHELIVDTDKFKFKISDVSMGLWNCLLLLIIGESQMVFEKFDGRFASLGFDLNENQKLQIKSLDSRDLITKLKSMEGSLKKLLLLNQEQTDKVVQAARSSKDEYKKFLKTYHPDRLDLHIIPKEFHQKFLGIYSEQFSEIKAKID